MRQESRADALDRYMSAAIDQKLYSNARNLRRHLQYIFDGIDLRDRDVLDIGGGSGLLAVYAAVCGARNAVCVEPEGAGSSSGMRSRFERFKSTVNPHLPVTFVNDTIQDYLQVARRFDVIVCANAINHLDEEACVHLHDDPAAGQQYLSLFGVINQATNPSGWFVATDCGRSNFFAALGTKSPFMPDIEWHKHQDPQTWAALLQRAGFSDVTISWSSPNTLGRLGRILLGNRLVAYFLLSHFRLCTRKLAPV
jgi:cyclopropane fatty-acyl-phospholipid synthase-like methyltransferase